MEMSYSLIFFFHFSEGSTKITYILVVPIILELDVPETPAQVQDLPNKVVELIAPVLQKVLTKLTETVADVPDLLKKIDTTTPPKIKAKPGN